MIDEIARLKSALADRYTIEREIGSGGMAVVYLAEGMKLRWRVAIKVLRTELAAAIDMGFINHRLFAEVDPFLAKLRGESRFEKLIERAKEKQREIEAET